MTREQAIEKEKEFLVKRHNSKTTYKVKEFDFEIPENIVDILCQKERRTKVQQEKLRCFREQARENLSLKSFEIKQQQLAKAKRTREEQYQKDPRYIKHFGKWVDQSLPTAKINREHYAEINVRSSTVTYLDTLLDSRYQTNKDYIIDHEKEVVYYSEEWCLRQQERALKNYDICMEYYRSLDKSDFEKTLEKFIQRRGFIEIKDITTEWDEQEDEDIGGFVYIMVLGRYKQVYIGMTEQSSIGKRILQHWTKRRAFDRLIWGSVQNSRISIDSFGPLDTTRIYAKQCKDPVKMEERYIKLFDKPFLLNRMA